MNALSRDAPNTVPLAFLAVGSSLMTGSLIGAGYCVAQAWRIEADTVGWLAAVVAFLLVSASLALMMIGLGYGATEVRRLLRFYTSPVRVVHMRRNRAIVLSGPRAEDDEDLAA
jgi:hypothetical protein